MDIRREFDNDAYIYKDLLQNARTLAPRVTSEKVTCVISSIDSVSLDAKNLILAHTFVFIYYNYISYLMLLI